MAGRRKQPNPRRLINVWIRNDSGSVYKRRCLIMGHWTLFRFVLERFSRSNRNTTQGTTYHMVWKGHTLEDSDPPVPLLKAYPIQDGDTILVIPLDPTHLDLPEPNPTTHPLYFADKK